MNWKRFSYFVGAMVFLGLTLLLAFGLEQGPHDRKLGEFAVMGFLVCILMHFVGRDTGQEDETSGIMSFDDDD